MKSVTAAQMKRLDYLATARWGIPALILMENAGRSAAIEALKMLPKGSLKSVAVFCGYGNNGGDGFVCARHLINRGVKVQVYLIGKKKASSSETSLNCRILSKMEHRFKQVGSISAIAGLKKEIRKYQLIIDAIFGIGLKGEVDDFYRSLFAVLNSGNVPILSLDIPSGLDADSGRPLGAAIRAAKTIAFGLLKRGLTKKQAREFTGKVIVGDISLPLPLYEQS